jgi:chromosome segregation ATPase
VTTEEDIQSAISYLTARVSKLEAENEVLASLLTEAKAFLVSIDQDYEDDRDRINEMDEILEKLKDY